jgi:hypothetical protein
MHIQHCTLVGKNNSLNSVQCLGVLNERTCRGDEQIFVIFNYNYYAMLTKQIKKSGIDVFE